MASSTKAGVTPAPPEEIRRSDATRSGEKPGAAMRPMKKVGGPTMNVICSASIRSRAGSGSHLAMNTDRMPAACGDEHAVEQAADVGQRARA